MAKMTLEEAAQLGLLDPETASRLGYSPYSSQRGSPLTISPGLNFRNILRYPGFQSRPGILSPRFGAGYGGGMTLSPEAPGIGIGGMASPVGRINSSGAALAALRSRGVAGGIAGNAAEGSGNIPRAQQPRVMSLPDGRRLVTYPDGRQIILPVPGSGGRPVAGNSPEGQAELAALGLAGRGVGIAQQLARLVGGGPEAAAARATDAGAGAGGGPELELMAPGGSAGLALGPGGGGVEQMPTPRTAEEAAFLEANMAPQGGAPSIAPGAGATMPAMNQLFGDGEGSAQLGPDLLAPPAPAPLSGFVGMPADTTFEMLRPGGLLTPPQGLPMAPGTTFEMPGGMPPIQDLALRNLFGEPGAQDVLGDMGRRRELDFGMTPEDIMAIMPGGATGPGRGRDLDPRGMGAGPSQADIFGTETAPVPGGGGDLNLTPANSLGLVQSLIGGAQGAMAGDPMAVIQGLLKSGMSIADIGKIPGLARVLTAAGAPINLATAAMKGDIPGVAAAAPGLINSAQSIMSPASFASLAKGLGLTANQLSAIGGVGGVLGGGYGLYNAIDQGNPLGGVMSAAQMYSSAAPLINSLAGPGTLPTLGGLSADAIIALFPELAASLGLVASTGAGAGFAGGAAAAAALGADAGIVGGAAGGAAATGAAGGAMAGASAIATPLMVAAAPIIIGKLWESLQVDKENEISTKASAQRAQGLASSIPGHLAAWQKTPGLLKEIQATDDPNEAARLYEELWKIQDNFQQSGMEAFLKAGGSYATGMDARGHLGGGPTFTEFAQGPKILASLKPFAQALDYGRMLAQDKAAAGGITVKGGLTADNYALNVGGPEFNEAYRPAAMLGSAQPGHGALLKMLGLPVFGQASLDVDPQAQVDPSILNLLARWNPAFSDPASRAAVQQPEMTWQTDALGNGSWVPVEGATRTGGLTNQDIQNYLAGSGADVLNTLRNSFGLYGEFEDRRDRALTAQLQALQPGSYEQGLRDIFSKGGWTSDNPYFAQMATAQAAASAQPGAPMAFDPLGFLSSIEQGQRVRVNAGSETLDFVPYKADAAPDFMAKDSGYSEISAGSGIYSKASGQAGGLEVYVPQDRAQDLGKGLAGSTSAGSQALAAALAASGQQAGATPGAGPATDITPVAPAQGQAPPPDPNAVAPTGDSAPVPGAGFKIGGVVPKTGKYLVHAGEVVVPENKTDEPGEAEAFIEGVQSEEAASVGGVRQAHHEQSETVQDENGKWVNVYGRNVKGKAGQPLPYGGNSYDTVDEAVDAAKSRSEEEGRKGGQAPVPEKPWYVNLTEGTPTQDVSDPTSPKVRRLAFTPQDVQDALEAGEAPIMVNRNILTAPPSMMFGVLKRAQAMQAEDPTKSPAVVAMKKALVDARGTQVQPEGDTLPGGDVAQPAARFPGDRGPGADVPLENAAKPEDMNGQATGTMRQLRPPRGPGRMPMIPPDGIRPQYPMSTSIVPDFGAGRMSNPAPTLTALNLRELMGRGATQPTTGAPARPIPAPAPGSQDRNAQVDSLLQQLDSGAAQPSTLEQALRFQRRQLQLQPR